MKTVWRVTVKRSGNKRVLVLDSEPKCLLKGDVLYLDDSIDSGWVVTKIEQTELLARIPIGKKRG